MKEKLFLLGFLIILLSGIALADFYPYGNIIMNDQNITGANVINATIYYGNGSQLTGVISSANSSEYWDDLDVPSDLNYLILSYWQNITGRPTHLGNFTDNLGDRGYDSLSNFTNDEGYFNSEANLTNLLDDNYRADSWNNLTGIPHATPSDNDVTHFSLADEIYDWVIGLNYKTLSQIVTSIGNFSAWDKDYSDLTNKPTNLTNFTDDLGNRGYTHLSNFTDNIGVSSDWDEIGDVPVANITDGDNTHLALVDDIYDWVAGNPFSWITNSVSNLANYYLKTETYNKSEVYNKTETYTQTEILALNSSWNYTTDTNETTRVDSLWSENTTIHGRIDSINSTDILDWDELSDLPTATPASGDTTHLSLSGQIYSWVIGLAYASLSHLQTYYYNSTEVYNKSEVYTQAEVLALNSSWNYTVNTDTQDLSYNATTDVISLTDGGSIDITEVDTDTNTNCSSDGSCPLIAYDSEINKTYVDAQDSAQDECSEITGCVESAFSNIANFTGTLTNTYWCRYDSANTEIDCDVASFSDTDTHLSQEQVEDFAGGMADGTETFITVTYNDTGGNFNFIVTDNWWNAYADFMGTTTTDKWCKWNGSAIVCNVDVVTDTTIGNCSVDDSCSGVIYETELDNLTELNTQITDSTFYDVCSANNARVGTSCVDILTEAELNTLSELDTQIGTTGTANSSTYLRGDNSWVTPTDTNTQADEVCSGTTTYLDGEGNCDDISNVYINEAGDSTGDLTSDLNIDSNTLVVDYDSDRVGIGVAAPLAKLHVYSNAGDVIFQHQAEGEGNDLDFKCGYNGYGWYYTYLGSGSGDGNEWQLWSEGAGTTDMQVYGIRQSGNIQFKKMVSLNNGTSVNDIDTTVANDDNALITSGGVYDGLASQDACSEITGCVENAITSNCSADQSCANVLYTTDKYLGGLSCADTEIAKWNNTSGAWECESDDTGAGGTVTGSGSAGKITKWTSGSAVGDSIITESGTNISIAGKIHSTDWTNVSIIESQVSDADWWDADGDINADEISESKINFVTACSAGDFYRLTGNDLECTTPTDTTYTAGNKLYLTSTEFNVNDTEINTSIEAYGYSTESGTVTSVATDDTYLTGGAITTTGTITFNTTLAGTNLAVNSSDYWDGLGSPSDINAGDITDDGTYRLDSWNNFTGIPTATPSDGDTTHLSTADQIRDYIVGLAYATTSYVDSLIASIGNWSQDKSSYWNTSTDLDTVIATDEITELKIDFNTVCAAGNHLYVNGNNLACETDDDTTYTAGDGITLTATQFNHTDTSSQASSNNAGRTYIQDIILDTYGHITSIVTATETVTDTDTQDLSYDTGTDVISLVDGGSIDITEVDTDTHLTEDQVEAYILDSDNTANLDLNNYNLTGINTLKGETDPTNMTITSNSTCWTIWAGTTSFSVCE